MALVPAERAIDAGLTILHQRTIRHSSIDCHGRRTAHREFSDSDNWLGYFGRRRFLWRDHGGSIRLSACVRIQFVILLRLGVLHFPTTFGARPFPRGTPKSERDQSGPAVA